MARNRQQWLRDLWNAPTDDVLGPILGFLPGAATYGLGFTHRVYERVGAFDESLPRMSDIDYTWCVQLAGFTLKHLPHAVVHYRHRDTLKGVFVQAYRDGQAQVLLYKKYREQGMPWESWWHGVKSWIYMIRRLREISYTSRKGNVDR